MTQVDQSWELFALSQATGLHPSHDKYKLPGDKGVDAALTNRSAFASLTECQDPGPRLYVAHLCYVLRLVLLWQTFAGWRG